MTHGSIHTFCSHRSKRTPWQHPERLHGAIPTAALPRIMDALVASGATVDDDGILYDGQLGPAFDVIARIEALCDNHATLITSAAGELDVASLARHGGNVGWDDDVQHLAERILLVASAGGDLVVVLSRRDGSLEARAWSTSLIDGRIALHPTPQDVLGITLPDFGGEVAWPAGWGWDRQAA